MIAREWKYGDSWESFPIEPGQVWVEKKTSSHLAISDLMQGIPEFMHRAEMIYCDPPWNLGNANSFNTKAGMSYHHSYFADFSRKLFAAIKKIEPQCCYLEIGKQNVSLFETQLIELFPFVQKWKITYYRRNPCFLLRGGIYASEINFDGCDDMITPQLAVESESVDIVGDLCTGRGLTFLETYKAGKTFVGIELNKRRLAVALEKVSKIGGEYERLS